MEKYEQIDELEWLTIYKKIKYQSTYKFMYTDVDHFIHRMNSIAIANRDNQTGKYISLTPRPISSNTWANAHKQHTNLSFDLKANFNRIISDINLIDLRGLSLCIEYVVNKLVDGISNLTDKYINCLKMMKKEHSLRLTEHKFAGKCCECLQNTRKRNVESTMAHMTIGSVKPSISEVNSVTSELQNLWLDSEVVSLSLLIDEVLSSRQNILSIQNNAKLSRSINDQITSYLQSIPQSVINMSREDGHPEGLDPLPKLAFQQGDMSLEISRVLNETIKEPIRALICRIIHRTKKMYEVPAVQRVEFSTQTPNQKNEDHIRALTKDNQALRNEIEKVKQKKRETENEMIKMIELQDQTSKKSNEINSKYRSLEKHCELLQEQIKYTSSKHRDTKAKLEECLASKKQLGETLIKEYTLEKSFYLKSISDLETTLANYSSQSKPSKRDKPNQTVQVATETENMGICQAVGPSQPIILYQPSDSEYNVITTDDQKNYSSGDLNRKLIDSSLQKSPSNTKPAELKVPVNEDVSLMEMHKNTKMTQNRKSMLRKRQSIANYLMAEIPENESTSADNRFLKLHKELGSDIKSERQNCTGIMLRNYLKQQTCQDPLKLQDNRSTKMIDVRSLGKSKREVGCPTQAKQESYTIRINNTNHSGDSERLKLLELLERPNETLSPAVEEQSMTQKLDRVLFIQQVYQHYERLQKAGLAKIMEQITSCQHDFSLKMEASPPKTILKSYRFLNAPPSRRKNTQRKSCEVGPLLQTYNANTKSTANITYKIKESHPKEESQGHVAVYQFAAPSLELHARESELSQSPAPHISKQSMLLLFESVELMAKYEDKEGIWKTLDKSIILDWHLTSECDRIQYHFNKLKKTNFSLYQQCLQMLATPKAYFNNLHQQENSSDGLERLQLSAKKDTKSKVIKKAKFMSSSHIRKSSAGRAYDVGTDKDNHFAIRTAFHKLLRFHKIAHQNCNHIREFLTLIGLSMH